MGLHENTATGANYLYIIEGSLRKNVPEDTHNAIKRVYEKRDGTEGVKYELQFSAVSGVIEKLAFRTTDFGKMFEVYIDGFVFTMSTDSRYFKDFASKIGNIDLAKEIKISPYDFEKGEKRFTGLSIVQGNDKVMSYFWDGSKNTNDFPEPENGGDGYESDDWKFYFMTVKKFLIKYLEENFAQLFDAEVKTQVSEQPGFKDAAEARKDLRQSTPEELDKDLQSVKEKASEDITAESLPF